MKKSNLTKHARTIGGLGCALLMAAGVFAYRAKADEQNRRTVLTVGQTIQVEDTVLQPGKYILKAVESPSNLHIVQIFNGTENHVFATVLTIPAERATPTGQNKFEFWETPAGTAPALRTWYYPGMLMGDEFTYPKHPYQLEQKVAEATPPPPPPPAAEPAPAPAPEPQAAAPPPEPDNAPVIAQNNPPPPPAPAANPAPAEPQQLPQTASPYPLFGLAGLVCLGLFGVLQLAAARSVE